MGLAYSPLKAALFRYQWVQLEEINIDSEGFTIVDLTKTTYKDDPSSLQEMLCKSSMQGTTRQKEG